MFAWIDRMLSAPSASLRLADWGPPKDAVARAALANMLHSNADLAVVFVDRSYSPNQQVAAGYFQVGWGTAMLPACAAASNVGCVGLSV